MSRVRPGAVVAAYLLAAICVIVPLAVLGSTYAGVVLAREGLKEHGAAVVVLGIALAALRITVLN